MGRPFRYCFAILALGGCTPPGMAEARRITTYHCADGRLLSVVRNDRRAQVSLERRNYPLARKPSGIGLRYASPAATLIIDGDTAVFVTPRITDLKACRAASS